MNLRAVLDKLGVENQGRANNTVLVARGTLTLRSEQDTPSPLLCW